MNRSSATKQDLADNSVQALAWTKYVTTVGFTAMQQRAAIGQDGGGSGRQKHFSSRARRLMTVIGILDLVAYALHCLGKALAGSQLFKTLHMDLTERPSNPGMPRMPAVLLRWPWA